ncbi:sulfotransferase family protein [Maricaulis sp. CAU 1757]
MSALATARTLTQDHPEMVDAWLARARAEQASHDLLAMRRSLAEALALAPGSPLARLMDCEALIHLGHIGLARQALSEMVPDAQGDASWLARLSEMAGQVGDHDSALSWARAAVALKPDVADYYYGLATALIATGGLDAAEDAFDAVIRLAPDDFDAYYNRSTLRRQTAERNHVDELRRLLAAPHRSAMAPVQLNYALGKELEDLGLHDEAFRAYSQGAERRRRLMQYRVDGDVAAMRAIADNFGTEYLAAAGRSPEATPGSAPVFILGLPRSGSTLLDRMLSRHSDIESLGELNDFPLALTELCRGAGSKGDMIAAASTLDPARLGAAYRRRVEGRRTNGTVFHIDKAPSNFLYIGLIARALPEARIIHIRRDPMDNAFSMFKALFRMGYPFSYDFADLAAYMTAHTELMAHWKRHLGDRLISVDYEALVAEPEARLRDVFGAMGLDYQTDCLDFTANPSPTVTHSAAQVRQPLNSRSVGVWRRHERQLAPLAKALGYAS